MVFKPNIGVEIEASFNRDAIGFYRNDAENLLPKDLNQWRVKSDGSIPGGGWEFVSPILNERQATQGQVSRLISIIKNAGGKFIDPVRPRTLGCLESAKAFSETARELGNCKDGSRLYFLKQDLEIAREKLFEDWKRFKDPGLTKLNACGYHIHVSINWAPYSRLDVGRKARKIYNRYYNAAIKPLLPEARLKGGMAHGWCDLYTGKDAKQKLEKYRAINVSHNYETLEFRQGSVNSKCTPEEWIDICIDITIGAWLLLDGSIEFDKLPTTFNKFRQLVWKFRSNNQLEQESEKIFLGDKMPLSVLNALKEVEKDTEAIVKDEERRKLELQSFLSLRDLEEEQYHLASSGVYRMNPYQVYRRPITWRNEHYLGS